MKLFGPEWEKLLGNFFDKKVTFQSSQDTQDASGAPVEHWEDVEGYIDMDCCIGDRMIQGQNNLGSKEPRTVILIPGDYPGISVEWRAIINGDETKPYRVDERTPNQSEDVTEIPVSRWY